ncbi:CapA family protein [Paenibacillus wulumuqiensis]|uniref:CapA family protein n=1 Tax=Paenibacillus wulumuqiensis TaxID=1567107 RepID=UPI00061A0A3A|nr:CapA family protein [Paenibacillus wulumuqiensis]
MYTTRSEQSRQQRLDTKRRRRRRIRLWVMLNTVLALAIVLVGAYYLHVVQPQEQQTAADFPAAEQPVDWSGQLSDVSDQMAAAADSVKDTAAPSANQSESSAADSVHADRESDQTLSPQGQPDKLSAEPSEGLQPATDTALSGQTITMNFGGDVMFSGKVGELLAQKGYDYPYEYIHKLFTSDDLSVVNLETPVTDSATTAADKTYAFKSSPQALPHMAAAGIDAVNLANNHILDQGITGLQDTISQLDSSGISYVGAGNDSKRAYQPVYFQRKGIKIALLGFSRVIPETSWNAGTNQPGVATAYDATAAETAIREARSEADLVVVIAHWGVERSDTTAAHQNDLAHRFVDAGADLVIGGHPHVLQGLEQYKGKWIAYSTGNFIFTRSLTEKTWDTAVFQAKCTVKGDCSMQVIPYAANLGQPVPMPEQQAQALLRRLQTLSGTIRFDVKGNAIS